VKQGGKKPILARHSFAQLSEILEKLEKVIKKQGAKGRKCCKDDVDSNME
jgi:hypothetical protein